MQDHADYLGRQYGALRWIIQIGNISVLKTFDRLLEIAGLSDV